MHQQHYVLTCDLLDLFRKSNREATYDSNRYCPHFPVSSNDCICFSFSAQSQASLLPETFPYYTVPLLNRTINNNLEVIA